jgi:DNA-directed RNA polymerase subunit RPC12/RpoP
MSEKAYECNSCGYQIFAEPDKTVSDNWCPACRATMYEADIPVPDKLVDYKCEECGAEFKVPAASMPPYKCPKCNFTFPYSMDRHIKHRL